MFNLQRGKRLQKKENKIDLVIFQNNKISWKRSYLPDVKCGLPAKSAFLLTMASTTVLMSLSTTQVWGPSNKANNEELFKFFVNVHALLNLVSSHHFYGQYTVTCIIILHKTIYKRSN